MSENITTEIEYKKIDIDELIKIFVKNHTGKEFKRRKEPKGSINKDGKK